MFTLLTVGGIVAIVLFALFFAANQYRRCASDEILVVFGKVKDGKTAECIHGGGKLVIPLIQDYKYLSLKPLTIDIPLKGALSKNNIRVNIPSSFTIAISTVPALMQNAAERLLTFTKEQIAEQARDIITGQLRAAIANMTIEQINSDRDTFLREVNENVTAELNKLGLSLINVNVQDLTDESGYIKALGQKAASEAINKAHIDVAEQERSGAIGVANATTEKVVGEKQAEQTQRTKSAEFEARAIEGENQSRAKIAEHNASLAEREADAKRRGEVARANALRDVALAEKDAEVAKLQKAELAKQEVEKQKVVVNSSATAEQTRLLAQGEADAIRAKYDAEAEGIRKVLEAKASGYERLVKAAGKPELASTLLMIEKMEDIVKAQAEMVKNVKIDKITVWDSGKGETSNFLQQFSKFLPPFHELAGQAGVKLPNYLGTVDAFGDDHSPTPNGGGTNGSVPPTTTKLSAKSNGAVRS
jgi:flotillin